MKIRITLDGHLESSMKGSGSGHGDGWRVIRELHLDRARSFNGEFPACAYAVIPYDVFGQDEQQTERRFCLQRQKWNDKERVEFRILQAGVYCRGFGKQVE